MTDQERTPILLTREQRELLLPHALYQAQREDALSRESDMPESMFTEAMNRIEAWEDIAAQLRALDAGEGE